MAAMVNLPDPPPLSEYEFIVPCDDNERMIVQLIARFAIRRKMEFGGAVRTAAKKERDKSVHAMAEAEALATGYETAMNEIVRICANLNEPPPLPA